jgi:hypothetical protein
VACFSMRKRSSPIVWRTAVRLLVDALGFLSLGFRSRSQLAAENLFFRAVGTLSRALGQASPCRRCDADRGRPALRANRLESRAHYRATCHADPVASPRIPPVLAMEVESACWHPFETGPLGRWRVVHAVVWHRRVGPALTNRQAVIVTSKFSRVTGLMLVVALR